MSSHKPHNIFVQGPIPPELVSECLIRHSQQTDVGAHSLFLGQVRSDPMGTSGPAAETSTGGAAPGAAEPGPTRPASTDPLEHERVKAIHYTAYEEMALEKMEALRKSLFDRYSLTSLHIYHSLGFVPAGAISLLIIASAPHRRAAIDACTELVESIKSGLPIWGQEVSDNQTNWKTNK
jgi:molybdopterin synthase catalytic subunit